MCELLACGHSRDDGVGHVNLCEEHAAVLLTAAPRCSTACTAQHAQHDSRHTQVHTSSWGSEIVRTRRPLGASSPPTSRSSTSGWRFASGALTSARVTPTTCSPGVPWTAARVRRATSARSASGSTHTRMPWKRIARASSAEEYPEPDPASSTVSGRLRGIYGTVTGRKPKSPQNACSHRDNLNPNNCCMKC